MQFAESFDHDADDVMEEVLADAGMSPTLTPFVSLGTEHSGLGDVPATPWQCLARMIATGPSDSENNHRRS